MNRPAFTLVELLVVVSIVVILLALLMPGLDRAIYQAELALCGTQIDQASSGAMVYAMDHKRRFPYRAATDETETGNFFVTDISLPFSLHQQGNPMGYDDRPRLRPYMNIQALLCPLAPQEVDMESDLDDPAEKTDVTVHSSYSIWFGWRYRSTGTGKTKLGDRISYPGYGSFPVMLGDWWGTHGFATLFTAHPDANAVLTPLVREEEPWSSAPASQAFMHTHSWWAGIYGDANVGHFDLNYGFDDGSVRRYNDVDRFIFNANYETRFDPLPNFHGGGGFAAVPNQ